MKKRTDLLSIKFSGVLLILWLSFTFLSYKYPLLIIFPFLAFIWYLFPIIPLVTLLYLIMKHKKWTISESIVLLMFIIPASYIYFVPNIIHEVKIQTTIPTNKIVRQFMDQYFAGTASSLDRSSPLINYNEKTKVLDIYLKANPDRFIENRDKEDSKNLLPTEKAKIFINGLFFEMFLLPINLQEKTTVPSYIHVYCYWGDTLISKLNIKKKDGHYKLIEPYPTINLVGKEDSWFLEFEIDGIRDELFIKKEPLTNFSISFDPWIQQIK
ncbi:hypothetical protein [Paenibacillus sp. OAE614]|uniref:hypothetical protein n=1 Tax=Paenibacillus sp. OAE614 TaxID=2663804 RepID=UPI0017890AA3